MRILTGIQPSGTLHIGNYFGAMMLNLGEADAMVSGYARSYPSALRPILETVGKFEGVNKVAATNLMLTPKGPIFISDTSVNIDPSAQELANIAQMTNHTIKMLGLNPVIAMISYSNFVIQQVESVLWLPNSFTPNGDGLNDFFKPEGTQMREFQMRIFTRYGDLIYTTEEQNLGWEGT